MKSTIPRYLLLLFVTSTAVGAVVEKPVSESVVTTLVKEHPGAAGGLVVDKLGYLYIADFEETVWRMHPESPKLDRFAIGFYGASGSTFDRNGTLFQANYHGDSISQVSRTGESSLRHRVDLNGPVAILFDGQGDLLVCACNENKIKKILSDGTVTDIATSGHFSCPNGMTHDDEGNLYVVSFSGSKIIKITVDGLSSVFADSQGGGIGHITYVRGNFYATSFQDNKIYRITRKGELSVFAGSGERAELDGPVGQSAFSNPNGIYPDPTGTYLYVNDFVGDPINRSVVNSKFSIRQIELPRLDKLVAYLIDNESIEAATNAYHTGKGGFFASEDTDNEITNLGWRYMAEKNFKIAAAVFELDIKSYPDSWRAYSSLGAAYMKLRKNSLAIEALENSLRINPENAIGRARLDTLQEDE